MSLLAFQEAAHAAPTVGLGTTLVFAGLLAGLVACLALEEKIHAKKSLIAGVFAVICLILGGILHLLPFGGVTLPNGHVIGMPVFIPGLTGG